MTPFSSILITGASSGIGAALASHYAAEGVTLHLGARSADKLAAVAADCEAKGATVRNREPCMFWLMGALRTFLTDRIFRAKA